MDHIKTIAWKNDKVILLDQRKLPEEEVYVVCDDYLAVARCIENMTVRGAPAIGVAAAYGVAVGAIAITAHEFEPYYDKLVHVCERIEKTRPTAVNLFWATGRMKARALREREKTIGEIKEALKHEAFAIEREDIESCHRIGKYARVLFNDGDGVLTHCNAGALATAGIGTALAGIYSACDEGKRIHVYADETRPRLQGAKLTAWELQQHGIEVTLICDNMAASLMRSGKIKKVIVGADRIAKNGDVANKIGTYGVAVLAKYHHIPFYVAAPFSTIDLAISDGTHIPIEERKAEEVTHIGGERLAPTLVDVWNPAFDVTPAELVTAIITDRGILEPPFEKALGLI